MRVPVQFICFSCFLFSVTLVQGQEVTCVFKSTIFGLKKISPAGKTIFRPGERVEITCTEKHWFRSKESTQSFTCQNNGRWDHEPICEVIRCEDPRDPHMYWQWQPFYVREERTLGAKKPYSCRSGYKQMAAEATCTRDGWTPKPLCAAKQKLCPDLSVENGLIYSTEEEVIYYSCNTGYKTFSGNWWDSVTCSEGSWSEEPRCIPVDECGAFPSVPHGKLRQIKNIFRDGETTAFECDRGFIPTPRLIKCVSGTWETPVCEVGVRCGIPPKVENAFITSKPEEFYVDRSKVTYVCQKLFSMIGKGTVSCRNGFWEETPTCKEVMCVKNLPANMRSDRHPGPEVSVRPGVTITLSCVREGLELHGQSRIRCLESGEWNVPFPKCVRVKTCPLNTEVEDLKIERSPNIEGPAKPGHTLRFSCNGQGLKLKGASEIICQPNGEWSSPYPKCEEVMCVANLPVHMRSDKYPGPEVSVRPGETITLSCVGEGVELEGRRKIQCLASGEWNPPFPKCVGGKCGKPPSVNSGDTIEMTKPQYNSGERVEYSCFSKFTLDQRPPYSKYMICDQGEWKGNIRCLKPCTVTVEIMDKRGIQLHWIGNQKMFVPHEDYITFACQRGNRAVNESIAFRQQCNDGVMTLPECE